MQDRGPAAYLAEFIGTFMLVFMITAAVSLYVVPPSPEVPIQPFIDFSVIGFVHVFVLFMLIQTLAVVSGAHFNPAITIALTAIRQIKPPDALIYIVVQIAGGILGALLTKLLLDDEGEAVSYGATVLNEVRVENLTQGAVFELIGTFFLVWAVIGVAIHPGAVKTWAGLVIGATLGLGVMVIAPLTGAGFNPARSFGPALVSDDGVDFLDLLYVYGLGPAVGGLLAAGVYFYLFILPGQKGPGGMEPVG